MPRQLLLPILGRGVAGAAAALALAATPAAAAPATLKLRGPAAASLAAAGAKVTVAAPATARGSTLRLPVGDLVRDGGAAFVALDGGLRVHAGRATVRLTGLEAQLTGYAHVSVRAGDRRVALLALDRATGSWAVGRRSATIRRAHVTLTRAGARLLRDALDEPSISTGRIGRLTLRAAAPAPPAPVPALPEGAPAGARVIAGGTVRYAPRLSWLSYLRQAEGTSAEGGAAFDGTAFTLPVSGGWWDAASSSGVVRTTGTVRFRYSTRGIDLALGQWAYETTAGAARASTLVERAQHLSESLDPSLVGTRVPVFAMDPSRLAPSLGADGATLTWGDVPLTLAESGSSLFNAYPPGSEQGTVSISATLAPPAP